MTRSTAYIDMEFAGIYGTHQGMQIPVEIGAVLYRTETDSLSFAGKAFNHDIDVEIWKNITDDMGKRINGLRRVCNLASTGRSKIFNKKFHLDAEGRKEARKVISSVYEELREFMQALNHKEIDTLVFFASKREMETFRYSGVRTDGFILRDLQAEIRSHFRLREHISLDRASLVTDFRITRTRISSSHFSYLIPEKFCYLIKPHKAIGDASRMFLVDREFHGYPEKFGEQLTAHIREYERRNEAEKNAADNENGQI